MGESGNVSEHSYAECNRISAINPLHEAVQIADE